MKKVTFMLIALLAAVVAFAALSGKQFSTQLFRPAKATVQLENQLNAKQAPKGLAKKAFKNNVAMSRRAKKAVAAADIVGEYTWDYLQSSDPLNAATPETVTTTEGSARVSIEAGESQTGESTATFNFNGMDVATSTSVSNGGDINEILELTADDVTLAVSPKAEGATSANRFWGTSNGPQLRVYSGTLTFTVPEGFEMTQIVFKNAKWNSGNSADNGEFNGSTWTGNSQTLKVSIAGNTQINSIEVTYVALNVIGDPIVLSGFFSNNLEGTFISDEDVDYFVVEAGQIAGTSQYGKYAAYGLFYYEGDDENEAGYYFDDIYGVVQEDGTIVLATGIVRVLSGGEYDGYYLTPYWLEGSILTPAEPLTLVEVPEGVEIKPYVMTYDEGNKAINVAVDGNDVYFQGMSDYLSEAWVKGTKDGNTVTFAEMQYMGEYGSYGSSYFFYSDGGENISQTVFTYDADADTYTGEGLFFGVLADSYYDGNYTNPVLRGVVEKAAMPANPEITSLQNGNYGWYFNFNVPLVDVNGDGLVAAKLSYMIYTDTEGKVAPLTFTPATHEQLTEEMTEIPFGFTENWDFYDDAIYLNERYSADWNNIGIQSIYRGGDEENITEIQWYHIKDYANVEAIDPDGLTYNFDDGMQGWTSIDADGDGNTWVLGSEVGGIYLQEGSSLAGSGHNGSADFVVSGSYSNVSGALTPDNYLVSPKIKLGAPMKFYASAQDASYPAEHFGVFVSTNGNTATADFESVQDWTLTASRVNKVKGAVSSQFRGPRKAQGSWYEFTVDLSAYEGQEGYVAIRHFDVTDQFLMNVDDISFGVPAFEIDPAEGVVESLNDFEITFNKYEVELSANAKATLTNSVGSSWTTETFNLADSKLSFAFAEEDITEPGEYTLTVEGVMEPTGAPVELIFSYTIEEPDVVVELPEGVVPEEFTLTATGAVNSSFGWSDQNVEETRMVAFDGNDIYVQGLAAEYFPDAYVKGTLNAAGQYVFKSGQLAGEDSYGPEYLVGFSADGEGYAVYEPEFIVDFDSETRTLTLADGYYIAESPYKDEVGLYAYLETAVYTEGALDLPFVELPEGVEPEAWTLEGFYSDGSVGNDLQLTVGVAFDGNDIYVQGLAYWFEEAWLKGTLDAESGIVTFPSGQLMGKDEYGKEFMVGFDEDICDIQYIYDANAKTLSQVTPYV